MMMALFGPEINFGFIFLFNFSSFSDDYWKLKYLIFKAEMIASNRQRTFTSRRDYSENLEYIFYTSLGLD